MRRNVFMRASLSLASFQGIIRYLRGLVADWNVAECDRREGRKAFFFEKKKQKTFASLAAA
jgi:hypothetical protein